MQNTPSRRRLESRATPLGLALALIVLAACDATAPADLLIRGGQVYDGTGGNATLTDVLIGGDRILFVGDAGAAGRTARDTVDATDLLVAPGFIDMHSHAELDEPWGRDAKPFLFQGITTVVLGVDGGGDPDVAGQLRRWHDNGIGTNAVDFVGHGAVRRAVLGMEARAPDAEEMERMRALVREGMQGGAFGLSSGLFYTPGYYAETEEVIELSRVAVSEAGEPGAIYDTHDRDLGASYQGIGYDASVAEGIRIGEESGARVIFSHFNPQGAKNYGRADVGARMIEEARARGVDVQAAQHPYTATQSNLAAYAIPRWAAAGGQTEMERRFDHPDTARILDRQTMEMLEIRGGADKIMIVDPRPELNGKTVGEVAREWNQPVPATVRRILRGGSTAVMNLDLYDTENTKVLARMPWMMTCTDGRTPSPDQVITHPRPFGAFTKKLRDFVLDEDVITMPFAIRSMTGLAADFLRLPDRGYLREGMKADVVVLDPTRIFDRATYQEPQVFSEGTVHVLVNGTFAIRDGAATGALAGRPLVRGGAEWTPPEG
ncbi:MAG: amidohydrolase family protein [Gemmatimonadota bacterium]